MAGKKWTVREEAELKALVNAKLDIYEIAAKIQKTPLGFHLPTVGYLSTSISIPSELLSVEEAIKVLAGALKASIKPGLNRLEVQRLQTVANIAKTYQELIVDYINYRGIEKKLVEMEEQNARLHEELKGSRERSPDNAALSVSE